MHSMPAVMILVWSLDVAAQCAVWTTVLLLSAQQASQNWVYTNLVEPWANP